MGGSHPAANGGAWMTAIFGFGGVRADENRIEISPRLCAKWKGLEFHLAYKGDGFQIKITKTSVTITPSLANTREHTVIVAGSPAKCSPGKPLTVKYRQIK
jgi:kojibiose phosphorylase